MRDKIVVRFFLDHKYAYMQILNTPEKYINEGHLLLYRYKEKTYYIKSKSYPDMDTNTLFLWGSTSKNSTIIRQKFTTEIYAQHYIDAMRIMILQLNESDPETEKKIGYIQVEILD